MKNNIKQRSYIADPSNFKQWYHHGYRRLYRRAQLLRWLSCQSNFSHQH